VVAGTQRPRQQRGQRGGGPFGGQRDRRGENVGRGEQVQRAQPVPEQVDLAARGGGEADT
jgi:hypothetical protein